jgi:hypothetical protein
LKRIVITLALCILMSACGSSSGPQQVVLTADKSGSDVTLELRNRTDTALEYNLCASVLQRRNEGSWLNVPVEDEDCTAQRGTLQPGRSVKYTKKLPEHLEVFGAGTYRYETRIEQPPGTEVRVASNSFDR